jgi:hypothetical protein
LGEEVVHAMLNGGPTLLHPSAVVVPDGFKKGDSLHGVKEIIGLNPGEVLEEVLWPCSGLAHAEGHSQALEFT